MHLLGVDCSYSLRHWRELTKYSSSKCQNEEEVDLHDAVSVREERDQVVEKETRNGDTRKKETEEREECVLVEVNDIYHSEHRSQRSELSNQLPTSDPQKTQPL
jgi:hypothetical protein